MVKARLQVGSAAQGRGWGGWRRRWSDRHGAGRRAAGCLRRMAPQRGTCCLTHLPSAPPLQEIGPRFTLKLQSLQKGTFDSKGGEFEWVHKPETETTRKKMQL